LLDHPFGSIIAAFAEHAMAQAAGGVDEKERRPGVIVEGTPDGEVAVGRDGVIDAERR